MSEFVYQVEQVKSQFVLRIPTDDLDDLIPEIGPITLDVFTPRRNDGFLDMVFAYQDIGKIGSLLLYTAGRMPGPLTTTLS